MTSPRQEELGRAQRVAAEIAVATRAKAKVKAGRDERQARDPARGRRVFGEIPSGDRMRVLPKAIVKSYGK